MTPARLRWLDPDFRPGCGDAKPRPRCCVCGKLIRNARPRKVRLADGGAFAVHPEDLDVFAVGFPVVFEDGNMAVAQEDHGDAPIGPDCAAALGLNWSRAG